MTQCEYCENEATGAFKQGIVRQAFSCDEHVDAMFLDHTGLKEKDWTEWREKLNKDKDFRLNLQNQWRETYDDMSYNQMQSYYTNYVDSYGYEDQYGRKWWDEFFETLKDEKIYVIELGGHRGGLAARMLKDYDNITNWINFEVDRIAAYDKAIPTDPRYIPLVLHDYLWNAPTQIEKLKEYRLVFVGAHVLEHIKKAQLIKLLDKVIVHCQYVGIEVPLETLTSNWTDFDGSHILEIGWTELVQLFKDRNYMVEFDGKWNAKMTRLGVEYNSSLTALENHDRWRKNYDNMDYGDQMKYYNTIFMQSPYQRKYSIKNVSAPFENMLKGKGLNVIEFGGYQGELAHEILRKHSNILLWDNFEITDRAIEKTVCNDKRYTPHVTKDFIWNLPARYKYDLFISSHTIEHITGDDFKKLVFQIIRHCNYVILEIPLPMDMSKGVETWKGYHGTHIQELSWNEIVNILYDAGFTKFIRTGEYGWNYFGWKELKNDTT